MENQSIKTFRSNGKLLISGEYFVLDGASALAIPCRYGQTMKVAFSGSNLEWNSYTVDSELWFSCVLDKDLSVIETNNIEIASNLINILKVAFYINSDFKEELQGKRVDNFLEFPQNWGLGSSSTMINNIAQWAKIDPFLLQQESFPGSGYDIACAFSKTPIIYKIVNREVSFFNCDFYPKFYEEIYFVHLNKKQNSREGIKAYREKNIDQELIDKVSEYSEKFSSCEDAESFRKLIGEHERIVASALDINTVKKEMFPDFHGAIKSLGAWGGDFVMVIGSNAREYFFNKGYKTIIPFEEMIM